MEKAYAPYSKFLVGACLRAGNGSLVTGGNIENASYGLSLCAEACALSALVNDGQRRWSEILVISSGNEICFPCGACRQRLFEFSLPDSICHLCTLPGVYQHITMKQLLPFPFGAFTLGVLDL
ncbi:MAG: cytidine deaminase [Proteobacteria bacterium]|nr:cytidine deaminase [Pseudomonadota bacterium]